MEEEKVVVVREGAKVVQVRVGGGLRQGGSSGMEEVMGVKAYIENGTLRTCC